MFYKDFDLCDSNLCIYLLPNLVGGALLLMFVALLIGGFLVFIGEVVFEPEDDEDGCRKKRFSDVFKSVFTRRVVPGENDILRTCF